MNEQFPLALPVGTNVNGYVILKVIGQGGFGITYLAYDTQTGNQVALKEYLPASVALRNEAGTVTPYSVSGENDFAQGKSSFLKEAQNLGRFRHEAIVQVRGYFEANGTAYTVMEFAKGDTLSHRIKQLKAEGKTMPEEEIMKWFTSAMDGLECVHKEQFLHRDIKPDNIMIDPETGKACLIDFGAARHDAGGKTKSLSVVLTPGFAPIEQYSSDGKGQGTWTDVYALGATVWCAMAGEAPKDAPGRSTEVMYGHPDPIAVDKDKLIAKGYSEALVNTVARMLEINSQDRVKSISDVKNMLRCGVVPQANFGKTVAASGASPVFVPVQNGNVAGPQNSTWQQDNESQTNPTAQQKEQKKKIFAIVAILVVLLLGGAGYYYNSDNFKSGNDLFERGYEYYQAKDYTRAVEYWQKAREKGSAKALYFLGECYETGRGVGQSWENAMGLYGMAANAGVSGAEEKADKCHTRLKIIRIQSSQVGSEVVFGKFVQDDNSNIPDDIEWILLKKSKGMALLISKYCLLPADQYGWDSNLSDDNRSWATSQLRRYLNGDFYENAFSASEKELILEREIFHYNIHLTCEYVENKYREDTSNKVFILGSGGVNGYIKNAHLRKAKPTPKVLAYFQQNCSDRQATVNGYCGWLCLETITYTEPPEGVDIIQWAVDYNGDSNSSTYLLSNPRSGPACCIGVRPVIWVKYQ